MPEFSGELKAHYHSALVWCTPEDAFTYDLAPADIPLTEAFILYATPDQRVCTEGAFITLALQQHAIRPDHCAFGIVLILIDTALITRLRTLAASAKTSGGTLTSTSGRMRSACAPADTIKHNATIAKRFIDLISFASFISITVDPDGIFNLSRHRFWL